MTISAKVTMQEFEDTRRIIWQPHYRLNRFNNYCWHRLGFFRLMGCVLIITIAWADLEERFGRSGRFFAAALGVVVLVGMFLHFRSPPTKILKQVNDELPEWIDLDEKGLTCRTNDGRSVTMPWNLANKWGATETVIVIQFPKSNPYVLPLMSLSKEGCQAVREAVRLKLGAPAFQT